MRTFQEYRRDIYYGTPEHSATPEEASVYALEDVHAEITGRRRYHIRPMSPHTARLSAESYANALFLTGEARERFAEIFVREALEKQ